MLHYSLQLPAGTTIDMVFFNFYDKRSDRDLYFSLYHMDISGSLVAENLIHLQSEGAPGYGFLGKAVYHDIVPYHSYYIIVEFPGGADENLLFSGVDIIYTEPGVFGLGFPAIQK